MSADPVSCLPPTCPIEVRISLTKSTWFDIVVVAGTQGRIVETSDTMWDIGQLRRWLEEIVAEKPNAVLEIDREGEIDVLQARHVDAERVRLTISDWPLPGCVFVDAVVSRRKLVWEIYYELKELSLELGRHFRPEWAQSDPDWLCMPAIEQWLDWSKHSGPFSMVDKVAGMQRA